MGKTRHDDIAVGLYNCHEKTETEVQHAFNWYAIGLINFGETTLQIKVNILQKMNQE